MTSALRSRRTAHESEISYRIRQGLLALIGLAILVAVAFLAYHRAQPPHFCAPGMVALQARCCGEGQTLREGHCTGQAKRCAPSMVLKDGACQALRTRIHIKGGVLELGPIDWEAQRRVHAYRAVVEAFSIDSHEVTEASYQACHAAQRCAALASSDEPGLPRVNISLAEAEQYCRWQQGTLPSRDQFAFAVMAEPGRRYPWGPTGAVCRRAAFGLADGPCSKLGRGPQLAGTHPSGASADGVHDLAGNVAEWVRPHRGHTQVRGGSWRSVQAAALRGWSFQPLARDQRRNDVGFRCVYPPASSTHHPSKAHHRSTLGPPSKELRP